MQLVVAGIATLIALYFIYNIDESTEVDYVYYPAPRRGDVVFPNPQYTAPITNYVGSPWLGGTFAPEWSYDMNSGG